MLNSPGNDLGQEKLSLTQPADKILEKCDKIISKIT